MVINNLGSITQSLGAPADSQDVYVTMLSVANCLGRQGFGYASDALSHRLTRPGWIAVSMFGMAASTLLLTVSTLPMLYLAAASTGLFYGVRAGGGGKA